MPYEVIEQDGQYCVVKIGEQDSLGCHVSPDLAYAQITAIEANETKANPESKYATELQRMSADDKALWLSTYNDVLDETNDDTKAYARAWGAVRRNHVNYRLGIKSFNDNGAIIQGWGTLFTDGSDNTVNRDLDNEFFSQEDVDAFLLDYYQGAPLYYEHGLDPQYGKKPIGKRLSAEVTKTGIWLEHQLHASHPLYDRTLREIEDGLHSHSVDGMPAYSQDAPDGRLEWSAPAWSITQNPAEPGLGMVQLKQIKSIIKRASTEAQEARDSNSKINSVGAKSEMETNVIEKDVEAKMDDMPDEELDEKAESDGKNIEEANALIEAVRADLEAGEYATAFGRMAELTAIIEDYQDMEAETVDSEVEMSEDMKEQLENMKSMFSKAEDIIKRFEKLDNTPKDDKQLPTAHRAKSKTYGAPAQTGKAQKPSLSQFMVDIYDNAKHHKSVSYQTGPQGGYLLHEEVSNEIIPFLRSKLVLDELGVQHESLVGLQELSIPKMTSDLDAYWVGEGAGATATEPGFDVIRLQPKTLMVKIPVPRQYFDRIRMGRGNYESFLKEQASNKMKVKIENAAFFGANATTSGNTGPEPLGLLYQSGVTKTALNRTPTLDDLSDMELRILNENVEEGDSWGLAMSPRTWNSYVNLASTTGQPLIRDVWRNHGEKQLIGYPVQTTTNIPNNSLGTSDDQSYAFMGRWDNFVMGMGDNIEFEINPWDNMGNLFVNIYAWVYVDFGLHRDEAFEVLTDIDD